MKESPPYPLRCDKCGRFTAHGEKAGRIVTIRRKGQKTRVEFWCTRGECGKEGRKYARRKGFQF